ncbi:hypothetical protein CGCSCA4_v008006 [Colletotrichum siamense]|uniref:Uncharacterized protein n=1 Tax=Colletotrichum siamense TaxID=690259 RepID=A0A9P5F132_COLSI|nr:hypothetical protein CGCSCA4_v008006 [Colletotrichum siamense]KAF4863395.1 hypothetical protein CGCSCA2_v002884 [Colletotrichum siamense]
MAGWAWSNSGAEFFPACFLLRRAGSGPCQCLSVVFGGHDEVSQQTALLVGRHLSEDPRPSTWLLDWTQQPDIGRSPQLPRTRTRTKDQEPGVQPAVVASRHATYLPA